MNKYTILLIIIVIIAIIFFSIFSNTLSDNDNNELEIIEEELKDDTNSEKKIEKDEYKDIKIGSKISNEIFEYIPKQFQSELNKMNNEYIIFSVLSKLNENNKNLEGQEYLSYSKSKVEEETKKLFGDQIEIELKDNYDYPITYNSEEDIFHIVPFSFTSTKEYQYIKSIKENSKEFVIEIYLLNIEYDFFEDIPEMLIDSKETFKQYAVDRNDLKAISDSKITREYNYEKIDLETLVKEYKDNLPISKYTLIKNDEGYYISNIDTIY